MHTTIKSLLKEQFIEYADYKQKQSWVINLGILAMLQQKPELLNIQNHSKSFLKNTFNAETLPQP